VKTYGLSHVYGVKSPLPLKGFPGGKVRIRCRHNDFTKVYIQSPAGIYQFYVREVDGFWIPGYEVGRNFKRENTPAAQDLNRLWRLADEVSELRRLSPNPFLTEAHLALIRAAQTLASALASRLPISVQETEVPS
jgi:hypothetical protein